MKKNFLFLFLILFIMAGPSLLMAAPSDQHIMQKDAYQLSVSLLMSAGMRNAASYHADLSQLQFALNRMPPKENAKKAWLVGRILFAAKDMGDHQTAALARDQLKTLLKNNNLYHNAYYAWALGYLAAYDGQEYHHYKTMMLNTATVLTQDYDQQKLQKSAVLSQLASDAMWAWIMDLKAAANANDSTTYHFVLNQMKKMTEQPTVAAALASGLTKNDYPAWAHAIVMQSAMALGDRALARELARPLADAINNARPDDQRLAKMTARN